MLKIMQQLTSSGTTAGTVAVSTAPTEQPIRVDAWNTAEVGFVPAQGHLERPLSAIAALAVDLGPADLSTTFRKRRAH
jgi:hypothetical protein